MINIKIHNNSKKENKIKIKIGDKTGLSTLAPYSSFSPTIAPNTYFPEHNYPQPNYRKQMVGSGFRDAVYPTQNTATDLQIPEAIQWIYEK